MGELLDALAEKGWHHELGFSAIEAYGVERAGRSKRASRDLRAVARRLRTAGLNEIRKGVLTGRLNWSMAELLARHATPKTEKALVEEACRATVREMTARLRGDRKKDPEEPVQATRTMGSTEVALLELTRRFVEVIDGARPSDEHFLEALLAEANDRLDQMEGRRVMGVRVPKVDEGTRKRLEDELEKAPPVRPAPVVLVAGDPPLPETPLDIDAEVRRLVREMAERDLAIGELVRRLRLHGGPGWLGYASSVHGGRIEAEPPASDIHWKIGRTPIIEVRGREVVARRA